jgi:hypothetical protein
MVPDGNGGDPSTEVAAAAGLIREAVVLAEFG